MVINIGNYGVKRKKTMNTGSIVSETKLREEEIQKLMDKLSKDGTDNYTIKDAEHLADVVLYVCGYVNSGAVPIRKIAGYFKIKVYNESNMPDGISGNLYVGGTTKDVYGHDKIIIVKDGEDKNHQRFVTAHELAHYLIDYVGHKELMPGWKLFCKTYPKEGHNSEDELRADRFAAELLMPEQLFLKQYNRAMEATFWDKRYVIPYLANYFQVKESCIERRIMETIYG